MRDKSIPIAPPGLSKSIREFKAHYEVAEDDPILLIGPSGVGKSVFIEIYKELEKEAKRPEPLEIDCSSFVGEDPNIAKSEIFGHVKGAFTGADKNKDGLIKTASKEKKAIILDEIGELPQGVQAALLIFIETGRYRPVGSMKEERAKTRIIAATNREENLRDELRYRFFKFYIPGLHERRPDVLYYFTSFFEDLFKKLRFFEILALLSYHWPGNVRELKQIGKLLQRIHKTEDFLKGAEVAGTTLIYDKRVTGFNTEGLNCFYDRLSSAGVNMARLDIFLRKRGIGFSPPKTISQEDIISPFNLDCDVWQEQGEEYILSPEHQSAMRKISAQFYFFCCALSLDYEANFDLLTLDKWDFRDSLQFGALGFVDSNEKKDLKEIMQQVKKYLLSDNETEKPLDLSCFNHKEIEKEYFAQLLRKTNNNKTQAAKLAGLELTTFRDKLKKHNL